MGIKDVYSTTQRTRLQSCCLTSSSGSHFSIFFKLSQAPDKKLPSNDAKVTGAKTQNAFLGTALLLQYAFALIV